MTDWCIKLKNKLEKSFSMPFEVSLSVVDGEEQYTCYPTNSEDIFFAVKAYIHDQIRLVVEIAPQKNAGAILNDMAHADNSRRKIFFQYIDVLNSEKAKISFSINNELITNEKPWPENWRFFRCRMDLIPIPEVGGEEELSSLLAEWLIHGTALILSLLTVEEDVPCSNLTPEQEGEAKEIISKRYERSRVNREICLAHKGYSCHACGFNFLERYGQLGKDYIEVHHTTPVSEMGDNYKLDIDRDLVPVCSNCHSMIHRRNPPLSIEELKDIILKRDKQKISQERKFAKKNVQHQRLIPEGSLLKTIEPDTDERRLIHNMMELDEGTSIMQIVVECQKQFQEKYFSMKTNDWLHLIGDYVRNVTGRTELRENDIFSYKMTG